MLTKAIARPGKFVVVGFFGFLLQLAILWLLTSVAGWSWLPATIVAVEAAIVHNFAWHRVWTWSDSVAGFSRFSRFDGFAGFAGFAGFRRCSGFGNATAAFLRFNASTALTSIVGNVVLMAWFVRGLRLPVVLANVLAVGVMSAANFLVADWWVFRRAKPKVRAYAAGTTCVTAAIVLCATPALAAPPREALDAWSQYVAQTEARLDATASGTPCDRPAGIVADGRTIPVPSATISHWQGSVFIPRITVERVLERLQHPGTPPPQEDVTASRVLGRGPDSLRVYMRLVRHAIVTVSYDTEHEMTFRPRSSALATARSVATRIDEVGGGDHGFLWRLNSYWRYQQQDDGVLVTLESLTLSRDVPVLVRPIAGRLVPRIARESMVRTLEALKGYLQGSA